MPSEPWLRSLAEIKALFNQASKKPLRLRHTIYEYRRSHAAFDYDVLPGWAERREHEGLLHSSFGHFNAFNRGKVLLDRNPPFTTYDHEWWDRLWWPRPDNWLGLAWFHGEGYPEFCEVAAEALELIKPEVHLLPVPVPILADLRPMSPKALAFLPDYSFPMDLEENAAYVWAHVVHWIGRERSHPVFRLEERTWLPTGATSTTDSLSVEISRRNAAANPMCAPDFDGKPPRLYSEIVSIFRASAWALDWIDQRVRDGATVERPASTVQASPSGSAGVDSAYSPPTAAKIPAPPIVLGDLYGEPVVLGHRKPSLTPSQYQVVKALIDAFPNGLAKDSLARKSGVEDPIGVINRLRRDSDWAKVLRKPGKPHGGYSINAHTKG